MRGVKDETPAFSSILQFPATLTLLTRSPNPPPMGLKVIELECFCLCPFIRTMIFVCNKTGSAPRSGSKGVLGERRFRGEWKRGSEDCGGGERIYCAKKMLLAAMRRGKVYVLFKQRSVAEPSLQV